MTASKGLHAKLAEVMAEAERIPKNGTAPAAMGGFKFVQVGDAADFIRKALGTRGVSMLPSVVEIVGRSEHETSSGKAMTTAELRVTWTLTDAETKESAVIQSYGVGADTGDKYSGKAMSNAMKYALLAGFQLSTGDDVEQSDTSDRQARSQSGEDVIELLGVLSKSGTFERGTATLYKGEWREEPDGHAIGLRLKLAGEDKDIPQVLIRGAIGEAVYVTGDDLVGMHVTVKGRLYNVKPAGRRAYYRLVIGENPAVDFIQGPDWRIPAPVDTVSTPMFSPAEDEEIAKALGVTA